MIMLAINFFLICITPFTSPNYRFGGNYPQVKNHCFLGKIFKFTKITTQKRFLPDSKSKKSNITLANNPHVVEQLYR